MFNVFTFEKEETFFNVLFFRFSGFPFHDSISNSEILYFNLKMEFLGASREILRAIYHFALKPMTQYKQVSMDNFNLHPLLGGKGIIASECTSLSTNMKTMT